MMQITKVLGNNVITASHVEHNEIILVGKGIGFKKKPGDLVDSSTIEKTFVLHDDREKVKYEQLITQVSETIIECMDEVFLFLKSEFGELPQELLVNLTDHVAFSVHRIQTGMLFKNPFLTETKLLYPQDYAVARKVCEIIEKRLNTTFPDDEVGLISTYIHTVSNKRIVTEVRRTTHLISEALELVEDRLKCPFNKDSLSYSRFLYHLRATIERLQVPDLESVVLPISDTIRETYPESYLLAQNVGNLLSQRLNVDVPEAELVYLAIHLERVFKEKSTLHLY